jgi:hypothetical protein
MSTRIIAAAVVMAFAAAPAVAENRLDDSRLAETVERTDGGPRVESAPTGGGDDVMKREFSTLDTDRDGGLTAAELSASTTGFSGDFHDVDTDGDGKVSSAEWQRYRSLHGASGSRDEH